MIKDVAALPIRYRSPVTMTTQVTEQWFAPRDDVKSATYGWTLDIDPTLLHCHKAIESVRGGILERVFATRTPVTSLADKAPIATLYTRFHDLASGRMVSTECTDGIQRVADYACCDSIPFTAESLFSEYGKQLFDIYGWANRPDLQEVVANLMMTPSAQVPLVTGATDTLRAAHHTAAIQLEQLRADDPYFSATYDSISPDDVARQITAVLPVRHPDDLWSLETPTLKEYLDHRDLTFWQRAYSTGTANPLLPKVKTPVSTGDMTEIHARVEWMTMLLAIANLPYTHLQISYHPEPRTADITAHNVYSGRRVHLRNEPIISPPFDEKHPDLSRLMDLVVAWVAREFIPDSSTISGILIQKSWFEEIYITVIDPKCHQVHRFHVHLPMLTLCTWGLIAH